MNAAWKYHNATKHSVASLRANRHYLDWENKPRPFKIYPNLEPIPLPRELPPSRVPALAAIAATGVQPDGRRVPDLVSLARALHFSAGITHKKVYPGGEEQYFRAAACTGGLYHIDLYVICGDLPGLSAGVYHFGPHDFGLHQLRSGDYRRILVDATGQEPAMQRAPVILACASTYWRNSWKYQARAYRHCFWDCGTVLANLLAVAAADELPARVVCGFVDATVERLLDLDRRREGALALVPLGFDPRPARPPPPALPVLALETVPLSPRAVDYPAIREMHAASALQAADEVKAWREGDVAPVPEPSPPAGQSFPLPQAGQGTRPNETIDEVIGRRGSTRRFARVPIQLEQLSTVLHCATRGVAADFGVSPFGASPTDLYLIVNAVDGLPSGAYVYHHAQHALELLRAGNFRREAGHLGLGQEIPADANVDVFLLCNLDTVLSRFGNRGYRVAQLDAAIIGGKIYLAAYALRLGASGLTFFDDDVTDFFSPHAAGKSVMFLVAGGRSKKPGT